MKAPAFQLYASDFFIDTIEWSLEEVGLYTRLLFLEWVNGPLTNDHKKLSKIVGISARKFNELWLKIERKFIINEDNKYINIRLEETREKQVKYSISRKKGAEAKWNKSDAHADAHVEVMQMHKVCSPSPSPTPTLKIKEKDIKDSVGKAPKRIAPQIDFDVEIEKVKQHFENGLKTGVESFILLTAQINKTGKIAQSRELSILGQLSDVLKELGADKFKYGLYAAIDANAPNINYVKKAAQNAKVNNEDWC